MAYLQRLIVTVLIAMSASAHALIPTGIISIVYGNGSVYTIRADPSAACADYGPKRDAYDGSAYKTTVVGPSTDKLKCIATRTGPYGLAQVDAVSFSPVIGCPSNSVVSGTACACIGGYKQNSTATACVIDTKQDDACTDAARLSLLAPKGDYDLTGSVSDQTICLPSPTAPAGAGCKSTFAVSAKYTKPDGSSVTNGVLTPLQGSGSSCSLPSVVPQPTANPCPDGQPGTVNGKTVCLAYPPGTAKETIAKVTQSGTATGPAGASSSASSSTSVTSCIGDGACTTTTTTTGTSGGAAVSGSSTKTQSKDSFCAENPSSAQCSEGGVSDGGLGGLPELYKAKYPAGIGGVWTAKKAELMASPLMSVGNKLMPSIGSGGVCPVFNLPLDIGPWSFGNADLSPACWLWDIGKAFTIIGALLLARALIFGG